MVGGIDCYKYRVLCYFFDQKKDKPMTLTDLLTTIGDDNLSVQLIDIATINVKDKQNDTEITFATQEINANNLLTQNGKVGIVVWCNRDDYENAIKGLK